MIVHMKLASSMLVILSAIGNALPHDDVHHHLATDCLTKGMKAYSVFEKYQSLSKFVNHFIDRICGGKCLIDYRWTCDCDDTPFDYMFDTYMYCCIQTNETCIIQGALSHVKLNYCQNILLKFILF